MGLFRNDKEVISKEEVTQIRSRYNLDTDRFRTIYSKSGKQIILDIVTGVNYFYSYKGEQKLNGNLSATSTMTPLLGSDGKPLVYTQEQIKEVLHI